MAKAKTSGRKTVRFTEVVKRSGEPRPHTLWLAPEKDPDLKRAVAAHRVMMIERGGASGKTDVGTVGFEPARAAGAQVLIFPNSLEPFEGARVVGVKFDLVEQPKMEVARASAVRSTSTRKREKQQRARESKPPPQENVIELPRQTAEAPKSEPGPKPDERH